MASTLISIIVILFAVLVIFFLIDRIGLPGDFGWLAKAVVALLGIVALLKYLPI